MSPLTHELASFVCHGSVRWWRIFERPDELVLLALHGSQVCRTRDAALTLQATVQRRPWPATVLQSPIAGREIRSVVAASACGRSFVAYGTENGILRVAEGAPGACRMR